MSDPEREETADLVLDVELDVAPEKVWRAVSIPAFREQWLPTRDLAEPQPVFSEPGIAVRYRMREAEPPHVETIVTFEIRPAGCGGTRLTIYQGIAPQPRTAANDLRACLRLVA